MVRKISQIPVRLKPSSGMPSNFFIKSILKGKRDVSAYKNFIFQSTTDAEKYEMIQNVFVSDESFVFPTTQRLFLHRWFKLFPWLCYSLVEDGAYCLPCLLFAGKKNTAAKSFIFKPFKHWPDGMGAFKRHIDPEHGVHNKCMFDCDQLISLLKGKNVSIDVSVNSLSNEKVLNNRKIILAIIDAIKLCGRLVIELRVTGMPQNITQKLDMHQLQLVQEIFSILLIMLLEMVIKFSKTI